MLKLACIKIDGVYKSGFATKPEAYEAAVTAVFSSLERVEKLLEGKEFLIGGKLTEADIRLFVTIIRFDPVYVGHFKCNIRTIRSGYPNIHKYITSYLLMYLGSLIHDLQVATQAVLDDACFQRHDKL